MTTSEIKVWYVSQYVKSCTLTERFRHRLGLGLGIEKNNTEKCKTMRQTVIDNLAKNN